MRIVYVCYWDFSAPGGVPEKIRMHTAAWRAAGHDVHVLCLARGRARPEGGLGDWTTFPAAGGVERVRATRALEQEALRLRPDVAYVRYDLYTPPLPRLLRSVRSAVEINTDDRVEARVIRSRGGRLYNELNRRVVLGRAAGFVCVTHELAERSSLARLRKPTIVLANGIDLDAIEPLPAPVASRPRAVFLGTPHQPWQGVDKVLRIAEALDGVDFDIVGCRPEDTLAPPPPNVSLHGVLPRSQYTGVLARADVAIGTLALHRKGMTEASPLKVREYLAHGVPVVLGYEDTDFIGDDPWFLLRLPNVEDNVDAGRVALPGFIERVRGRRVRREEIAERIGSKVKEARRLEFLARLLD